MTPPDPASKLRPDRPGDHDPRSEDLLASYAAMMGARTWEIDDPDILSMMNGEMPFDATREIVPDDEIPEAIPVAVAVEVRPHAALPAEDSQTMFPSVVAEPETPPTPLQILESMLFLGGGPLSEEVACRVLRGWTGEQFQEGIETLNRTWRSQHRPYLLTRVADGWQMSLRPRYRAIREKIDGGPRQVRLTQAMTDCLALIAYKQPLARIEIDTIRGMDSTGVLRNLIRLNLIAVVQRGDAVGREICYGTTGRFLEVFGLRSMEDLPRTGEAKRV